jgi:hypothetical protein
LARPIPCFRFHCAFHFFCVVSLTILLERTLDSLVRVTRLVGRSRCVKRPERACGEADLPPPREGARAA